MAEIKVIHSPSPEEPYAVIFKPAGLPSAPLTEGDESALTQSLSIFPELKQVAGRKKVEYGLLHRIDTATEGLLLIASTQEAFDSLSLQQKNGQFTKFYSAKVEYEGPLQNKNFTVTSRFRPFGPKGREVRPVFEDGSLSDRKKAGDKLYTTTIQLSGKEALCHITEGYRHQVRAHLAFSGYPIAGDKIYNPSAASKNSDEKMYFTACRIDFINPATGKEVSYSL